ncbi:MAG: hypothetical protein ACRDHH_00250, partial [Actinomycetota bacterium]
MSQRTLDDPLAAAREALERHAWREAFDLLSKADTEGGLSAADLELLGEAAWWSGEMDACIAARERAYSLHLEAGETGRAGKIALALVRDHSGRLAQAQSNTWFTRAERLLEKDPDAVEHGYLEVMRARRAHLATDYDRAVEVAGRAVDTGARFGDPNLQALGLMYQGMGRVGRGEVEDGLALLDEATVAAVGGELSPHITGIVYCNMIST